MTKPIRTPVIVCQIRSLTQFVVDPNHDPADIDLLTVMEHLQRAQNIVNAELNRRACFGRCA